MKFGKKLQHQLDNTLPEWRPNFLCYKQLKKRLKQLGSTAPMAFLTAAILDGNSSIEDELPPGVAHELANGHGAAKRGPPVFEEVAERKKKRKGELHEFEGNGAEELPGSSQDQAGTSKSGGGNIPAGKADDENFLRLVKSELYKFNSFFLEKEEEFLIRLDILEERTEEVVKERRRAEGEAQAQGDRPFYEELLQVHRQIVTLHGEMVLLMDYSSLNYVGLLKILKKYDKHTGASLRQSVRGRVLEQPFFSTANLKGLVERSLACEKSLQLLLPAPEGGEVAECELVEEPPLDDPVQSGPIRRQTSTALLALQERLELDGLAGD